jgi:hypothetical protein
MRFMSFDVLALSILGLFWAVLGVLPWLVIALRRRGRGVLALLPLAAAGGIGGGVLAPALGFRDVLGLLLSLLFAVGGGLALSLAGVYFLQKLPGTVPPAHSR